METRVSSCLLRFGQKEINSGKSASEVLEKITSLTGAGGKIYMATIPGLVTGTDCPLVATLRREEMPAELTEKLFEMHIAARRTAAQWCKAYGLLVPVLHSWENGGMNEQFYWDEDRSIAAHRSMPADRITVKEGSVHQLEDYFQQLEIEKEIGS